MQTRNNLSSRAQPRDPVSPKTPVHKISPQPSKRVPHLSASCAERWEPRISTSARHPLLKQDKASRFPKLNRPPLKKPKARPAARCHPEEAESRPRDSQRRISALSPANQCRPERPSSRGPNKSVIPSAAEGPCVSQSHLSKQAGAPSFRVLCWKGGNRESRQAYAIHSEIG